MKNILLTYICLFGLLLPASAQQLDAKTVLDRTADAFRRAGGVEAEFTVQATSNGVSEGSSTGVIRLQGRKFMLDSEGVKTWFDGRTQWSYLSGSDEVNISEPTADELQSINPYALLTIYKQGYQIRSGSTNAFGGKSIYEVTLTAMDKRQDLQSVNLYIAKDTFQPLRVSMQQRGGGNVVIRITSYKSGQTYHDSFFTFDRKAYPTAEVIDLRD